MNIANITKNLTELQTRLETEITDLQTQDPANSDLRDVNNTEDDDAAESEDHSRIQARIDAARNQLEGVQKTLAKIHKGTYGTCERCGKSIPEARLQAKPTAIYDVACEELVETGRR